MVYCCVYGCSSRSGKGKTQKQQILEEKEGNTRFYKLPSEESLKQKWLKAINRKNFTPTKNTVICSLHFEAASFENYGSKIILKPDSCPSIFSAYPISAQVPCKKPRPSRADQEVRKATQSFSATVDSLKPLLKIATSKISFPNDVDPPSILSILSPSTSAPINLPTSPSTSAPINLPTSPSTSTPINLPTSPSTSAPINLPTLNLEYATASSSSSSNFLPISSSVATTSSEIPIGHLPDWQSSPSDFIPLIPPEIVSSATPLDKPLVPNLISSSPPPTLTLPQEETPRKKRLRATLAETNRKHREELLTLRLRYKNKLKNIREKLRRRTKRVAKLKDVIKSLKDSNLLNNEQIDALESLPEAQYELLVRQVGKATKTTLPKKYGQHLKAFALNLHYFSPRAYDFVRQTFNSTLPHPSTLSQWYRIVDGEPGFTAEAFDTLKEMENNTEKLIFCCLVLDEMAIRQQVQLVGDRYVGYVDLGTGLDHDNKPLAKDALVFLLVGLNGSWKIPVGYFLIKSLTGQQKAGFIDQCLRLAYDAGVIIKTMTTDGLSENISMATELGCCFDLEQNKVWFLHPITEEKIFYILDPCHMLKLIRNMLATYQNLLDEDGKVISWKYFENLVKLQEDEGLHLANRLRRQHVNYKRQIMKVRLAAQTFSDSVADALECCVEMELEEFQGCEATIKFIRTINNIFDIGNSKNLYQRHFKKSICENNYEYTKNYLSESVSYLKNLKRLSDEMPIVRTNRKTGVKGFIILCKNIINLYEDLCLRPETQMTFISSYKFSQDHVEMLFSLIRSKGGFNNNPSAVQFRSAYKKILVQAEFRVAFAGNCLPLEEIPILSCATAAEKMINISRRKVFDSLDEDESLPSLDDDYEFLVLSDFCKVVSTYIAGFVIRSIHKTLNCDECIEALYAYPVRHFCALIRKKDRGGLITPSSDVVKIINFCEQVIQGSMRTKGGQSHFLKSVPFLVCTVMKHFFPHGNLFRSLDDHFYDAEPLCDHKYSLAKSICLKYIRTRVHYITKNILDPSTSKRQQFTHLINFSGK